jgi:beta-xylosidase
VADLVTGPYRYVHSLRPDAGAWPENAPESGKRPLDEGELARMGSAEFPGHAVPAGTEELIFRRDFAGGQMARDMTLFADDDGAAYVIYASEENGTLHISQLSANYLTTSGRYIRLFPGKFNEAPAMMKHAGRYFLFSSGCTGWAPNPARLASAESIWGPWEELGNPCRGDAEQQATTFSSQSTFILPVAERAGFYIFMADRWVPANAIDGRYVWLPVQFENGLPWLAWQERWSLDSHATAVIGHRAEAAGGLN